MLRFTNRGKLGLQHVLLGVSLLAGWTIDRTTGKLNAGYKPENSGQVAGQASGQNSTNEVANVNKR